MVPRSFRRCEAGAGVVAVVLLCTWTAAGQASEVRAGLYRDGQLLDAFAQAPAAATATQARALSPARRAVPATRVGAPPISAETQGRNQAFAVATRRAVKIRELVRRLAVRGRPGTVARRNALRRLAKLAQLFASAENGVRSALATVSARLDELGVAPEIRERQLRTVQTFEEGVTAVDNALGAVLRGEDGAERRALELLEHLRFRDDPPLLSSGLPYDMHVEHAPMVPAKDGTPAASKRRSRDRVGGLAVAAGLAVPPPPPTAADLAATIDVQLTPEIQDKAAALGNSPVAIYEFVRNSVEFQPYLGSRKGSAETLKQLRGNDTDQASLLIALLRAAGIPSRYIRGTIELDPERAKSWLGVDDAATAASILATAGLDGVAIVNGPSVVAVQLTHVWVEAFVPYANYRGVPSDTSGKIWVPLDPSFKGSQITPGSDVLAAMGFNADTFLADYISTFHTPSPLEKLSADVQAYLDTHNPGTTVADIERTTSITAQALGLLPGSLPYPVVSFSDRLSELEDSKRYKVRFHLYNGGTDFIDYTITLPELIGKRPTIQYVGATPADQAVIDAFGGIYNTPPNLVNVKPLLKLDNVAVATATNAIGMGLSHSFDMQFLQPVGASNAEPLIQNQITAGNGEAIGFDTFLDVGNNLVDDPSFPPDVFLESTLYTTALDYLNRVDRGQEQGHRLMQMVTTQDVSEAIVANAIAVSFTFGVPVTFEWTGLIVDADRRIVGPFAVNGDTTKARPFMIVTGMDASVMENRVFEDRFAQEAISTIKILELASDAGIPICTITTSIGANCPGFSQPPQITAAVNAALAGGHVVTIPRDPITVAQWSGTGYIDMNPTTGAAGYIIGGGISSSVSVSAGGATVDQWPVNLTCLADDVTAETLVPPADSPDPSAVFCADDTTITFKVRITVTCHDGSMQTFDQTLTTHKTKKQIVDQFGPGDYELQLVFYGATTIRKITIFKPSLKEVSFTGNHTVKRDDGGLDFTAPHWQDNSSPLDGDADDIPGDRKYPVAYTRGATLQIGAKIDLQPAAPAGLSVMVRGTGPSGLSLPATAASVSGNTATVSPAAAGTFENAIRYFPTFTFTWEISLDGGVSWCRFGASVNPLYLTLADPVAGVPVFQTLLHIGSTNAAGKQSPAQAIAAIFPEFTDLDVRRVESADKVVPAALLTYYKTYRTICITTAGLLQSTDGQCGSWAHFLIDTLKVQGIDNTNDYVVFQPGAADGFLVNNWTFSGSGTSGIPSFPYLNIPDTTLIGPTGYNWKYAEVTDAPGIPGQGNSNPASLFNNHQVVFIGSTYYDPSYGKTFSSLTDIDNMAIAGYFVVTTLPVSEAAVNLDLNGDGDKLDTVPTTVFLIKKNPAGLDLVEMKFDQ